MRIEFHKQFNKLFAKLPPAQRERFERAIIIFRHDPYNLDLYNHPLSGEWKGHRSIAFGGDWRAHYIPKGQDVAFFVAIGRHSQLYK